MAVFEAEGDHWSFAQTGSRQTGSRYRNCGKKAHLLPRLHRSLRIQLDGALLLYS